MTIRQGLVGVGMTILVFAAGCAGTPKVAALPEGEWSGDGTFVAQSWPTATQPAAGPPTHATYPTELQISRHAVDGQSLYRVEITSERGTIPGLDGDRTHIVAYLQELPEQAGGSIALYRLQSIGMSFTAEPPKQSSGPQEPAATCIVDDDAQVLQIHYLNGFTEVFRFHRGHVQKAGTFYQSERGLVDWVESLERE